MNDRLPENGRQRDAEPVPPGGAWGGAIRATLLALCGVLIVVIAALFCVGPGRQWMAEFQKHRKARKVLEQLDEMEYAGGLDPESHKLRTLLYLDEEQLGEAAQSARALEASVPDDPQALQIAIVVDLKIARQAADPQRAEAARERLARAAARLLRLAADRMRDGHGTEDVRGMLVSVIDAYQVSGDEEGLKLAFEEAARMVDELKQSPDPAAAATARGLEVFLESCAGAWQTRWQPAAERGAD
jgi:hypothetical protein